MESAHGNSGLNAKALIGIVAGIAAFFLVQYFFFKSPTFDQVMMRAASELNKSCPMMVDKETRLDNTAAMPGNIFQYNYTLVNYLQADVDVEAIKTAITPGIVNTVKTSPDMIEFRKNDVKIVYSYSDKSSTFLFKIEVTPDQYK